MTGEIAAFCDPPILAIPPPPGLRKLVAFFIWPLTAPPFNVGFGVIPTPTAIGGKGGAIGGGNNDEILPLLTEDEPLRLEETPPGGSNGG